MHAEAGDDYDWIPDVLTGFQAARTGRLGAVEMLAVVERLRGRYLRTQATYRENRGGWIQCWLTRLGNQSGIHTGAPNEAPKITLRRYSDEDLDHWMSVVAQVPHSAILSVTGLGNRWRLKPNADAPWIRIELLHENPGIGLSANLVFFHESQWRDAFRTLFEVWGVSSRVELVGDQESFRVVSRDAGWSVRTPMTHNHVPYMINVYGWPSFATALDRCKATIHDIFDKATKMSLIFGIDKTRYEQERANLNAFSTAWRYPVGWEFEPGFDPFVRPRWATDQDPVRYPVLFWNQGPMKVPALQVDVVHAECGSFLELQSVRGRKKMQEHIKVAGVPFEFWEGPPQFRWNGRGGPPETFELHSRS